MFRMTLALSIACLFTHSAFAHFPWLAVDEEGTAHYFFGENPAERDYKLPEPIAKAEVMKLNKKGKARKVAFSKVETDDFVGMSSKKPIKNAKMLMTKVTYGMYAGSRLDYYSMHQPGALPKDRKAYALADNAPSQPGLDLQAQLVDTDSGVDVFVLWKGEPLVEAEVMLFCEDGHQEGKAKTNEEGKVSFSDKEVEDGLNGIMVGHKLKKDSGKYNGREYSSSSHYLTLTFHDPQDFE